MSLEQLSVIDTTAFDDLPSFVIEARNLMLEASAAYFVVIDWAAVAKPTVVATEQTVIASVISVAAAAGMSVLVLVTNQVHSAASVGVKPQAGVACVEIADLFACLSYLTGFQSIAAAAAVAVILKYYSEDPTVADVYLRDCFVEPLTAVAAGLEDCQAGLAISAAACLQCCFVDQLTDSAVYLRHWSVVPLCVAAAVAGEAAVAAEASLTAESLVFVVDEYQHWQTVVTVAAV